MTDEPREEIQDEEKDVEGHGPSDEKFEVDENDDVEAHAPPLAPPLQPPL
jgi:hypothetical protein